jgi:hypothetical protein
MADPVTLVFMAVSTATQYIGAQRQAKAAEYAADAAEQQGKYNAQIDVNNMVAEQGDIAYAQRAEELKKAQALQKSEMERKAITSELASKIATQKVRMPTFGGSFSDTLRASEQVGYDRLAAFDFGVSQETAALSSSIRDADRQLAYSYQRGLANRDLTLRTAANQATQYRNKASAARTQGFADLAGGFASMGAFASDSGMFTKKTPTIG